MRSWIATVRQQNLVHPLLIVCTIGFLFCVNSVVGTITLPVLWYCLLENGTFFCFSTRQDNVSECFRMSFCFRSRIFMQLDRLCFLCHCLPSAAYTAIHQTTGKFSCIVALSFRCDVTAVAISSTSASLFFSGQQAHAPPCFWGVLYGSGRWFCGSIRDRQFDDWASSRVPAAAMDTVAEPPLGLCIFHGCEQVPDTDAC
jgi:hypothetical protein